ncbi:4Fe-4S dicluster domain-containing protein [Desulfofundulus thermobenzoicus]|uniref:4Fe-4S dicluster domain-containing protein n=1 Tax=Desulfofundulus thermobenzoicus TaxID=29376 RepID=A0A6N7IRM0_9FIRM|nr:(Fe-S)-binding protein [Desulfofundulus thermobenzoicus]MQL52561.1 4Fe-4S dicluster domain-containing protein [Desulfofundulus thermobenzoicus]HHW43158.1 (Fe-S)-binding protein [Desulfotomaculum sp.]
METKEISLEMKEYLVEAGAQTLDYCMQCGLCSGLCPWRLVPGETSEAFYIRRMMRLGQLGLEGFDDEQVLFACTTCGMCQLNCPREVKIIDNVRSMRSTTVEAGFVPSAVRSVVGSLHANGNPWSGPREKRMDWQKGVDVPAFTSGTEYLLFVCCTSCYDPRSQRIARSVVDVLKRAGVNFGVIGVEESCCGETVRKIGDEELFTKLAESNIRLFREKGVQKIITTSPHCLYTFKNEYPALGGEFEVVHYTQLLAGLLQEGKLELKTPLDKRVAYHDPCYLGRHNGIFDAPRTLIRAIPGVEPVELSRSRERSLCCAGGGGRLWAEVPRGERFGELRVLDAEAKSADILATACPYCVIMLEADSLALDKQEKIQVMELSELLSASMGRES